MAEYITFHENAENPGDLVLVSSVYLRKDIRKRFENEHDVHNIFISNSKPYLYGFNIHNGLVRCDIKFE